MKSSIFLVACFAIVTTPAFAQEMQSIEAAKSVELRGSQLSASYEVAGGCAEHEGLVRVTLEKEAAKSYIARVALYDVVATADMCEAKISVTVDADLNQLIKQAAALQKISVDDLERVRIQLPALSFAESL